jgi:hypothetical protein
MLDEVPLPQMKHTERERERERGKKLRWLEAGIRQIRQIPEVSCNKNGE